MNLPSKYKFKKKENLSYKQLITTLYKYDIKKFFFKIVKLKF